MIDTWKVSAGMISVVASLPGWVLINAGALMSDGGPLPYTSPVTLLAALPPTVAPADFCAKFFKMSDLSYLHVMMKQVFADVYVVKPESSRAMSAEAFVIGIGFKADANLTVLSESITVL